jgi:hypothetical protein
MTAPTVGSAVTARPARWTAQARPDSANVAHRPVSSTLKSTRPVLDSRLRSRRDRSSSDSSSVASPRRAAGSTMTVSVPVATSCSHSWPMRVTPSGVRMYQTLDPSGETEMLRGMPSVNRAVRAASRGKETVMAPSHQTIPAAAHRE